MAFHNDHNTLQYNTCLPKHRIIFPIIMWFQPAMWKKSWGEFTKQQKYGFETITFEALAPLYLLTKQIYISKICFGKVVGGWCSIVLYFPFYGQ